ncbi:MAG: hypothetical protein QOH63_3844 [Acidobacteriota bacterium]|jgi:hypothetical protein|nr:hypothetical protein [Acidobacteriota bacterium]
METISLRFRYTEEEYIAAIRFYLTGSKSFLIRLILSFICVAAGIFLVSFLNLDSAFSFLLTFIGVVLLLIWSLLFFVVPRQRFRRDPKFRDEYFLQFSDDGIQFKTAQIDALVQWSLYSRVIENERFYILVYGENMISVIPRRAFASAQQEAAFDELLKRKLPACFDSKRLNARKSDETEKTYVPPIEPPDWR